MRRDQTSLEDLPDEILIEICIYLNPLDIIYAFDRLNSRLQCTISEFRSEHDFSSCSLEQFRRLSSPIFLQSFADRLTKLSLSNECCPGQIQLFEEIIGQQSFEERFPRLKSLKLSDFSNENITLLSKVLYVEELDLDFNSHQKLTVENELLINKYIFGSDNHLLKLTLYTDQGIEIHRQEKINRRLTDLTIQLVSLADLLILFQITQSLTHLEVDLVRNNPFVSIPDENFLVHLKEFYLHTREKEILPFETILKPLILHLPSIEYLSFGIKTNDPTYSNAIHWRDLFHSINHIQTFILGLEIDITSHLIFYFDLEDMDDLPSKVFQSFSENFPSFPISIYKNNQTLFLDSVPYRFSRNQSYSTTPQAVHALHTNRNLTEQPADRIVGLSITGEHTPIDLNDYFKIINRFANIQWLYLDSINVLEDQSASITLCPLKSLRSLIYMRSTRCQIHRALFMKLFSQHRKLETLKIMYGDLISFLRQCHPSLDGTHIQNLLLYISGADGSVHLKHLDYLIEAFPSLKHLTIEVTSNNLIKKHQSEIITQLLISMRTLQSFRIISRKGNLHFVLALLDDQQMKLQWLERVNARHSSLILQPKYFALWKINAQ